MRSLAFIFIFIFILLDVFQTQAAVVKVNGRKYLLDPIPQQIKIPANFEHKSSPPPASQMDMRRYQTQIRDQGERGTCTFFSVTALFESAVKIFINRPELEVNFAEEYLVWVEKAVNQHSPRKDSGDTFYNIHAFTQGFVLEKDVPYQPSWFGRGLPCEDKEYYGAPLYCFSHDSQWLRRSLPLHKQMKFETKFIPTNAAGVIEAMNSYHNPVVIGVEVNFMSWENTGGKVFFNVEQSRDCRQNPDHCGAHSILITGYDLSKKVFYFKNSWSSEWGMDGYGQMPFDYIDHHSIGGAYTIVLSNVTLPVEDLSVPQPNFSYGGTSFKSDGGGMGVLLNFELQFMAGSVAYVSSYLAFQKDGKYELFKDQNGRYEGDYRWLPMSGDRLNYNSTPLQLLLPEDVIKKHSGAQMFVKTAVFQTSDSGAYSLLFEEYKPLF